ncbi:hypothetical protein C8J57DRAFT_1259515 [Mycena rebaudengoi]|nr:hypothetical protein C8J57DRAFT_1259515 [Mycena rebaudengoi]
MRLSFALVFAAILCVDVLATPIITERAPDGTVFLDHLPPITIIDLRALTNATPNVVNTPDKNPANASGKGLGQALVMGEAPAKAPPTNASNAPKFKRMMDPQTPKRPQSDLPPDAPGRGEGGRHITIADVMSSYLLDSKGPNGISKDKWLHVTQTVGGSEGWMQVELEYAAKTHYEIPLGNRLREVRVYMDPLLRADVVIDQRPEGKCTVIELKVESSSINGNKFANVVKKDIDKLSRLEEKFEECDRTALAIAWGAATKAALEALPKEYRMLRYKPAELKVGEGSDQTIALYEWEPEDCPSPSSDVNPMDLDTK